MSDVLDGRARCSQRYRPINGKACWPAATQPSPIGAKCDPVPETADRTLAMLSSRLLTCWNGASIAVPNRESSERRPYRSRALGALEVVACRRYLGGEGGTVQDHEKVSGSGHRNKEL